ncbi:hypothetical protein BDQ94DRAFT_178903 [Aspergillus welwitschiae]|uniref:Uncharacterized protein n=1 Tax=Aspergillus welwitschiae TaxID=1341132 RepID=A0A3F3PH28_9EURO|nr:hypothetical protein BDQ94DRAFT_178903 [Aspergillus welwitschiae]RDH26244.1 hypothetical protein BDQ94DRAFT_178903 [Aspergillus welwitschiae]
MDEQRPLPPLEEINTLGSREALRTDERLGGVATAAEGFALVAAPVRQQPEDTSATEPVKNHQNYNVSTGLVRDFSSENQVFSTLALRSVPGKRKYLRSSVRSTELGRVYPDQPSSDTSRTYEAHASASMEGHRWSVSDMGRASDVAIPKDSGTERGSPTTCPADVTVRGEWNEIRDDGNSIFPYQIGYNAGWGPPSSATTLPNSFKSANHSTGSPTADPWHLMPWASEPYSWDTLPASFWGWTWSQSEYLTGSETDGFISSIPAPQAAGWPFGGEAEQPQHPSRSSVTHFWGDGSQVLYHPSLSFDPPEPFPSSDALGLSSILQTAPPSFPRFSRLQHVEDGSLALPAESPMLPRPWDPLAPVSAALPMTDFHRRSLHQQPSAPIPVRNIEWTVPPWLPTTVNYQGTEVIPFDNVGANRQESSCHVTAPEGQVEHRHSTSVSGFNAHKKREPFA